MIVNGTITNPNTNLTDNATFFAFGIVLNATTALLQFAYCNVYTALAFSHSFIATGFIGFASNSEVDLYSSNFSQTMNYDGGMEVGSVIGLSNG